MKTVFTDKEVAEICGVALRTVSKWCDSTRLKNDRPIGSEVRLIFRKDLIRFLIDHNMPLGELEGEVKNKVLLVGFSSSMQKNLAACLPERDFTVVVAAGALDAGVQTKSVFSPDCVVVDFDMGPTDALMVASNHRNNSKFADIALIGLLDDFGEALNSDRSMFDKVFYKPFDIVRLAEEISMFVGRRNQCSV